MIRVFNVTGSCNPKLHYMVDITGRLEKIKSLIDNGAYFTINRARQYGKTTTIKALTDYLEDDYIVVPLDFQRIGDADFSSEITFCKSFAWYFQRTVRNRRSPVKGFCCQKKLSTVRCTILLLQTGIDSQKAVAEAVV